MAAVTRACAEVAEVAEVASARGAWKGNAAEETAAAAKAARRGEPTAGGDGDARIRAEIAAAVERMEAAAARCARESDDGGGKTFESTFVEGG